MASKSDASASEDGNEPAFFKQHPENETEGIQGDEQIIEEETVGQIVQGEDGDFYVVVPEDGQDIELEKLNSNIEIVVAEDGTRTFVLKDGCENLKALKEQKSEKEENVSESSQEAADRPSTEENSQNASAKNQPRTVYAHNENGGLELVQVYEDDEDEGMNVNTGSGEVSDLGAEYHASVEPLPQGMKMRRNRVYGACRCPECGQSFVNTARLERHLAVHQVFGSFLCPLCGKTYKYEYNLFYHWRRNCRDLNELMPLDERKTMDVNQLRELVDEVAQKKAEIGPIDIGISRNVLFSGGTQLKMDMPLTTNVGPKRGSTCKICGVYVLSAHFPRHAAAHRGEAVVDDRSPCGGYFCDLCGLLFRHHFNLFKHWRTSCQEIQANLPDNVELTMDDDAIRRMVTDLVKRVAVTAMESEDGVTMSMDAVHTHNHKHEDSMNLDHVVRKTDNHRSQLSHSHYSSVTDDMFEDQAEDQVVYADDYMDDYDSIMASGNDESGVLTSLNGMNASTAYQRSKWSVNGGPVQCPECFRSFANSGRLERHLAGFHSAYGSHHCILCGNRFKYDYNLLYHYRRSCPYTKAFIDRDVREQMDATGLRKLVRNLASRDIRLNPHTVPPARMQHKRETGDALIRKQMMKYPTPSQLPPAHLMAPRPGLSDGRQCPVCAIFFYGNGVLERHMKAAHAQDYNQWEREHNRAQSENGEEAQQSMEEGEEPQTDFADADEPPPTLTAEQPSEQPIENADQEEDHMEAEISLPVQSSRGGRPSGRRPTHHIVNEHGISIAQISDISEVHQLIDSGELQVQEGDRIILMEDNEMEEYEGDAQHYYESEEAQGRASGSYQNVPLDSRNAVYVNSSGGIHQVDESGLEVATILTEMKHEPSGGHHSQEDVVYLAGEDGTMLVDEFGNPVVEHDRVLEMPGEKERTISEGSVSDELSLPISRVKAIVNQQPDTVAINERGLYAMTKATELFITELTKDAYSIAKDNSVLDYDDIADFVRRNRKYSFLQQFLPRRITVKEARQEIAEQAASREWASQDPLMHIYQFTEDDEVSRLLGVSSNVENGQAANEDDDGVESAEEDDKEAEEEEE